MNTPKYKHLLSLRARYSYGGRTPSPFNIEKPASAHLEAEGVRDAIKITPHDVQLTHCLDAFAVISHTSTFILETDNERMKRPARNIWAEIEKMLQTRIAKGPWKHISSAEMSE